MAAFLNQVGLTTSASSVMLPDEHNLGNLEKMERTYKKATFPQEGSGTAFSSTSVYWRLEPDVKD